MSGSRHRAHDGPGASVPGGGDDFGDGPMFSAYLYARRLRLQGASEAEAATAAGRFYGLDPEAIARGLGWQRGLYTIRRTGALALVRRGFRRG